MCVYPFQTPHDITSVQLRKPNAKRAITFDAFDSPCCIFSPLPLRPTKRPKLQLEPQWTTVACGRTRDQLEMTRAARRFLSSHGYLPLRPRSLNFWKKIKEMERRKKPQVAQLHLYKKEKTHKTSRRERDVGRFRSKKCLPLSRIIHVLWIREAN